MPWLGQAVTLDNLRMRPRMRMEVDARGYPESRLRCMFTSRSIVVGLLLVSFAIAAIGQENPVLVGTVTKVTDGDTIKVQLSSGPITVRFGSIDAPEKNQPWGRRARTALAGQPAPGFSPAYPRARSGATLGANRKAFYSYYPPIGPSSSFAVSSGRCDRNAAGDVEAHAALRGVIPHTQANGTTNEPTHARTAVFAARASPSVGFALDPSNGGSP